MGVKQQIPSSTNSPKSMQFAKLRGLDCSTSPFEVSPTRAVDMRNIINDDGINHKRQGWTENTELLQKLGVYGQDIVGIYQIDTNIYLVYNKNSGVIIDCENGTKLKDAPAPIDEISSVNVKKISTNKVLVHIVYLNSSNEYYFIELDKYNFIKGFEYAPITTMSINPDSEETSNRKSFEEPSLTTAWRRNTLLSSDKPYNVTFKYAGDNEDLFINTITILRGSSSYYRQEFREEIKSTTLILCLNKFRIAGLSLKNKTTLEVIDLFPNGGIGTITDQDGNQISFGKDILVKADMTLNIKEVEA